MIKCGLIDYKLDNFHANKFISLLKGELASSGVSICYAYEEFTDNQKDWCKENDVIRCKTPKQVVEKSDVIMVLAPDNIDKHLSLGKAAYTSGKRVYVDKFLAAKISDARKIVSLCEKAGTPLLSSSALRFSTELTEILKQKKITAAAQMFARGPNSWSGYGCHSLAPVLKLMGTDIEKIINTGNAETSVVTIRYKDGRMAVIETREGNNVFEVFRWHFGVKQENGYIVFSALDGPGFYRDLISHVVNWFKTGDTDITINEMLTAVWVLENGSKSLAAGGKWAPFKI